MVEQLSMKQYVVGSIPTHKLIKECGRISTLLTLLYHEEKMNQKPIPTEPYPRLIWYQETRIPCTPEEKNILFSRYYDLSINRLLKLFPNTIKEELYELAEEKANLLVEAEIHIPTILKKVVVNTSEEHRLTKELIEKSDNFLKWYKE